MKSSTMVGDFDTPCASTLGAAIPRNGSAVPAFSSPRRVSFPFMNSAIVTPPACFYLIAWTLADLFDHHIGCSEQRRRYCESKRFGSLQVHNQFISCRSLHWQVRWFLTSEDAIDIARRAAVLVSFIGSIGCEAASGDK